MGSRSVGEFVSVRWCWCRSRRGGRRRAAALEDGETFSLYPMPRAGSLKEPSVSELLFRFLTNEVRLLNQRLLDALYLPVERRVLRRLVELAELYRAGDGAVVVALPQEVRIASWRAPQAPTVNQVCAGCRSAGS